MNFYISVTDLNSMWPVSLEHQLGKAMLLGRDGWENERKGAEL